MLRYVWRELVRNPRRTFASMAGVTLGVGLFSAVLFFIVGSGASMTSRALAPLAIDMQRVLTNPLGGGVRLEERLTPSGPLQAGGRATITLRVVNDGIQPANEVVVNDQPPAPLRYVPGSTTIDGRAVAGKRGGNPLAQGRALSGLNIGRVAARSTVTIRYQAQAPRAVAGIPPAKLAGTISTRENVVPTPANSPAQLDLAQLVSRIGAIDGVDSADGLSYVDLPSGSLQAAGTTIKRPTRVFAFDQSYVQHHPSVQITSGSLGRRSAVLSTEASRSLGVAVGERVSLALPGAKTPLALGVSGVSDLSQAKPLFYSRNSTKLEDFLYLPDSLIVSPAVFKSDLIPAFKAASAARGSALKSPPVEEVDIQIDRSRLQSDPAASLAETSSIAKSIKRVAPRQDYLIDNVSNTLTVASQDAVVGRRIFLFLGLPGVLLAAFLAAYAGSVLASAQRRERATLRLRGADRAHLRRMLVYRTLAFASVGSAIGAALGFGSAMVVLGRPALLSAGTSALLGSAAIALGIGLLTTAIALYVPGRRSLAREISDERAELNRPRRPAWRRWGLDLALLAATAAAELIAVRAGAFDAAPASVYEGQPSPALPAYLLAAPLVAWFGGTLLAARVCDTLLGRLARPASTPFGPLVAGTLRRSLQRRAPVFVTGALALCLVLGLGVSLAMFTATYDSAKAADAQLTVGADIRVTPNPQVPSQAKPDYAAQLRATGLPAVSPVSFKLENSIVHAKFNQDVKALAAIDPASFERVAPLSDSLFAEGGAMASIGALSSDPRALLVDSGTADDLKIETGDRLQVLLARGSSRQSLQTFDVAGIFDNFPGFPTGTNLVANLGFVERATGARHADFFLASSADSSGGGVLAAASNLRSQLGPTNPPSIETAGSALNKDQSSLTALNVNGLLDLDSLYTLSMAATAIGIFVFGLMLQRRREYISMLAQGMRTGELQALVLAEAVLLASFGILAGIAVGCAMAAMLTKILQPLFVLQPHLSFPPAQIALLAGLAMAATLLSATAALSILRRLRPIELLRED